MSIDINVAIEAIGRLVDYAKQKAVFEADKKIREELEHYRSELFAADSSKSCAITTDLAVTKTKFRLLRQKVTRLPADVQAVFAPLLAELAERIDELRKRRGAVCLREIILKRTERSCYV